MKNENDHNIDLILVIGYGRSGSTLLESILGQFDDIFPIGEFRHVWERNFIGNQLCSCGNKFYNCDFWSKIISKTNFNNQYSIEFINKLAKNLDRVRYIPFLKFCSTFNIRTKRLNNYSENILKLFQEIRNLSGAKIILDTSKSPSYAYLLDNIPGVNVYKVHLVRDSRAVAYSWKRKKIRKEIVDKIVYMPKLSVFRSSIDWIISNLLSSLLIKGNKDDIFIKYEDLVEAPTEIVNKILEKFDLSQNSEDFIKNSTLSKSACIHSISGNPIRLNKEKNVIIQTDNIWKTDMDKKDYILSTVLTFPWLKKYKYKLFRN